MNLERLARSATNGTAAEENTVVPFVALDRRHQWLGAAVDIDESLAQSKEN